MMDNDIRKKEVLFNIINSKQFVLLWLQHSQLCTEQKYFDLEETIFTVLITRDYDY
jgi:hypothetical protein